MNHPFEDTKELKKKYLVSISLSKTLFDFMKVLKEAGIIASQNNFLELAIERKLLMMEQLQQKIEEFTYGRKIDEKLD